jgi:uncharacterized protein YoxC
MPLSAALDADFSDLEAECRKADVALGSMQGEAAKTEAAIADMATSAESSAGRTGAAVEGMGSKAGKSSGGFRDLTDGLKVADKSLGAFGVNISKEINVLGELGEVSGKTAADLGKIGTAGAVAAAAMAGWNLGRMIAEITGADAAFANWGSRLMGWGDVAAETAGAKMDLLNRASKNAGRTITDVAEAVRINTDAVKANAESFNTSANRVNAWEAEIQKAANSGDLAQIVEDLNSQNSTLEQLTAHYKISGEALAYLQRQMRATAEATREKEAADKKAAAEAQAHADAIQRLQDAMFGADSIAKANQYLAALGGIGNLTRMAKDEQIAMNKTLGEAIEAYTRTGAIAPAAIREIYTATLPLPPIVAGLGTEWDRVGERVTANADTIIGDLKRMDAETKAYEAETRRLVDEWNKVKPPVDAATGAVHETTGAARELSVALRDVGDGARNAWEAIAAGNAQMEAYRKSGIATGSQIALGGYNFALQQEAGTMPTYGQTTRNDTSTPWGTGAGSVNSNSTLNVNVNSSDARTIADRLVEEMRYRGVRF